MNPIYRQSAVRYLGFFAVACLIASLHIGLGAVVVWVLTAVGVYWFGRCFSDRLSPTHRPKKRRK